MQTIMNNINNNKIKNVLLSRFYKEKRNIDHQYKKYVKNVNIYWT